MRKYGRTDANQKSIVDALRGAGCSVMSMASLGKGVPDLLVARNGKMWLMEVKDGKQPPCERRLTEDQKRFHETWKAPIRVVTSREEALAIIAAL